MLSELRPYVIKQGDYLTKLAFIHGFNADEVWSHEKNADVKQQRDNPDILYPGDILYIPVKRSGGLPISKGASNSYRAKVPNNKIRVQMLDDGLPLASAAYTVSGISTLDPTREYVSDEAGTIEVEVPLTCREFEVCFPDHNMITTVFVGHLDPADEPSGATQRLENLGFISGADKTHHRDLYASEALAGLATTSGDGTARLKKVHGC